MNEQTNWMSRGFDAAEEMLEKTSSQRRSRNVYGKPGERIRLRFLSSAEDSLNYKRCYVPWAQGMKFFTSPGAEPDPFKEKGLNLQAAFAWKVIDRRVFEIETKDGSTKEIGPRIMYFADGARTRRALITFENEIRAQVNEEREEEGLEPYTKEEFNLSHFDVRAVKEKGAPWQFFAVTPGKKMKLTDEDKELLEQNPLDLVEELKPLSESEIKAILSSKSEQPTGSSTTSYAYGDDDDEDNEPTFFDDDND